MLNILDALRKFSPTGRTATKLYGSIVTQARNPVFYSGLGVSDTPEGRYEMMALHMALGLETLRNHDGLSPEQGDTIARALVERFVTDIDDSMRQLAVGDMAVPKRVKKAAAGLRERTAHYRTALQDAAPEGLLLDTIAAYVYGVIVSDVAEGRVAHAARDGDGDAVPDGARELTRYMRRSRQTLRIDPDAGFAGFAVVKDDDAAGCTMNEDGR